MARDASPEPKKQTRGTSIHRRDVEGLVAPDGAAVRGYVLCAPRMRVEVLSWGCYVTEVRVPDARGQWSDVVLGFDYPDDFSGYHTPGLYGGRSHWYGCVIGRFCGRIAAGRFELGGKVVEVAKNLNGEHHLHGGQKGWDQYSWEERGFGICEHTGEPFVLLGRRSPSGEEQYPAALDVTVRYSISGDSTLKIEYEATNLDTVESTVINMTNHSYFNLSGNFESSIYDHALQVEADSFCAVDKGGVPVEARAVRGTPFDFTSLARVGDRIDENDEQLLYGVGYDHTFVLRDYDGSPQLKRAGLLTDPVSGRRLEVLTTEPGLHIYSGNHVPLSKDAVGKGGTKFGYRSGLCLETQHFPDSPNRPEFPSVVLGPGMRFQSCTAFVFGIASEDQLLRPEHGCARLQRPGFDA